MGMNWIEYKIGTAGKAERNTFVVTVHVYCPACFETNTSNYRGFCVLAKKICSITTLAT
jgi:hypothetical protein